MTGPLDVEIEPLAGRSEARITVGRKVDAEGTTRFQGASFVATFDEIGELGNKLVAWINHAASSGARWCKWRTGEKRPQPATAGPARSAKTRSK